MSVVVLAGAQNTTATAYTAATEVVAVTISPTIQTLDPDWQVYCAGLVVFTAGATPGTVTVKIRQGAGITGAVVASWVAGTTVAATNFQARLDCLDALPMNVGNGNAGVPIYTATLTVAGSTGTGVYASMGLFEGSPKN